MKVDWCVKCYFNVGPPPGLGNGGGTSVSRSLPPANLITLTTFKHSRTNGETVLNLKVQLGLGSTTLGRFTVGAIAYHRDAMNFEQPRKTVKPLGTYWLAVNQPPLDRSR